jgi:hypothetical protein
MLVHKFYLVECIEVEFKFELNSNRFEWKQESKSVILSFLNHSRSLLLSVIPSAGPTCRPLLPPPSTGRTTTARNLRQALVPGPHAEVAPSPQK